MNTQLAVAAVTIAATLCHAGGCASHHEHAPVQHIVLIKLKDPAKAEAMIAEADRELPKIKSVVTYHSGRHLDVGRPGVDGDYDAGFSFGFRDAASYQAYLDDPIHVRLVNLWKAEWASVRMFDFAAAAR
jgi:hypothetical protein